MSEKNKNTCELFWQTSNVPVYCYDREGSLQFYFPGTPFFMDRLLPMFDAYGDCPAAVFSDQNSLFWGRIMTSQNIVIIGPVSMTTFSDRIRHALMAEHFVAGEHEAQLEETLNMIPRLSLSRFSATVRLLYQLLSHKILPDEAVVLSDFLLDVPTGSGDTLHDRVLPVFYRNLDSGLELYDISYDAEQAMIRNIESGNIEALKKSFSADDAHKFGSLADTTIRSTKNMFIVVIAIASRTAIRNGVSVQVAYKLSDLYIQEIEQTSSFHTLTTLVRNAVIDYSQRIQAIRTPKGVSPMVHQGMQYIEQSVTQPLSVADAADYVGKSVSYFSAEFKKETGMNVSSYITAAKIEEAKRLLKYTDSSLVYISNFLCFSSQSHFQKVFKTITGMTPLNYRRAVSEKP